jgi:hypothetical protein
MNKITKKKKNNSTQTLTADLSDVFIGERTDDSAIEQKLLFLVPLVQIAWSHGIVSTREKRLIFDAAREDGIDERHSLNEKLGEWLVYQPSRRFFNDCLNNLADVLRQMTNKEREQKKSKLLSRCVAVAAVAGDERFDDDIGNISAEERQSLRQILGTLDSSPQKNAVGVFGFNQDKAHILNLKPNC